MKYEGFKNMPLFNERNISNFDNWNFFIFKLFDDNEKNNNINKVIVNEIKKEIKKPKKDLTNISWKIRI